MTKNGDERNGSREKEAVALGGRKGDTDGRKDAPEANNCMMGA